MKKITEDKLIGLVDIYYDENSKLSGPVSRSEIASYIFSTILKESNRILETVNNLIDKINESEYYVRRLHWADQINKDTIIDNVAQKLKKDNLLIKPGNIICYCNPDTKEIADIRVFFSIDNDSKEGIGELNTSNIFKNKEDCIEAVTKKVKENIVKKYEKLIDKDYSYFLKNNSNIKQTSLIKSDSNETEAHANSPEVFKGEKGLEGERGTITK